MSVREQVVLPGATMRRLRVDDAEAMIEAVTASVEHLSPWMAWLADGYDPASTRANAEESEGAWSAGTQLQYVLVDDERILGSAALHVEDPDRRVGEVGYWLRPEAVGRGLARAAVAVLLDVAFDDIGLERVELWHDAANVRSGRVPDALGMRERERRTPPRDEPFGAEAGIDVVHEITREEWRARH